MNPALVLMLALTQDSTVVYSGTSKRIDVDIPRVDTTIVVDGRLDEQVWTRAARLNAFSQYQPVDGRPAEDPTEVMVWYSSEAIHFGVRASELHGNVVRATQANRDNIASEDQIQILLDTNNDRSIAYLFGVNPLGVQQDGTRSSSFFGGAGGSSATGGGSRNINPLEGSVDLNPDYVFQSRGRLVDRGYDVEIRIPFKSIRYQDLRVQNWGLHVLRRIQHSGFQDSWTPAVRANSNFLAQMGALRGLHDMHRGLVLEVTPTATGRVTGSAFATGDREYEPGGETGADVRWGVRQNLTLNGTINPDFSQVEADVGQVLLNERFALFYPEKRPFFLDGLELFDSPNQLIYTRRIVAPRGGVKLTGKLAGANAGVMLVADDKAYSWNDERVPLFGVARLRRTIGPSSTLGAVLTTREDGADFSRLASADLRFYHDRLYFAEFQAAQSWTDSAGRNREGSLLQADWDRTGRAWGFHYTLKAIDPGFNAAAGFVNRTGLIEARAFNRISFYGEPGAFVQTYGSFFGVQRIWDNAGPGHAAIETGESVSPSATLRGGWQVGGSLGRNSFAFDRSLYESYEVEQSVDTAAFTVPGPARGQWSGSVRVTTPTHRFFSATASMSLGKVPIFREAASGRSLRVDAAVDVRPTTALRGSLQLTRLELERSRDGSEFSTETIPRVKVEYQLTHALFLRLVGQYAARSRSPLEDRFGNPILVNDIRDTGSVSNELSTDWLVSYRPVPGTLVYLGYGSILEEPREFRFRDLKRTSDGLFGKVSYLFRL
ncbi:MAG: carbohydrate binding family 9 domain-containing protein [Gemmatimonadaceae bacterium]|nr:carbohydrate binding family 9 domain-containing protein [Gemmatimonadaceae bacterium]